MFKLLGLLKRREGLSPDDFQSWWRERHAPIARRLPGLRRYVQNHTRLGGYARREPVWDGVAELWFDDADAFRSAIGSEEMAAARADEPNFMDVSRLRTLMCYEHVVVDEPAPPDPAKLISFLVRRRDLSVEAFQAHWREQHGPIAARSPGMRRYVQCHVRPGSYGRDPEPVYDGVPIAWFVGTDAMRESDGSPAYERTRTDEANFLEPNRIEFVIAHEHVIVG